MAVGGILMVARWVGLVVGAKWEELVAGAGLVGGASVYNLLCSE